MGYVDFLAQTAAKLDSDTSRGPIFSMEDRTDTQFLGRDNAVRILLGAFHRRRTPAMSMIDQHTY